MKIVLLTFIALFVLPQSAVAMGFSICGIFDVEGKLQLSSNGKNRLDLVLDEGSNSEVRVDVGLNDKEEYKYLVGINISAEIGIDKKCEMNCLANSFKVISVLKPYEKPRSFAFPRPKPLKLLECR